ncbi:MAG: polyhydroxyalkanoate synthesis repressor PhaR [Rhizobiales bacterium]|nr:polyhydroxyalkanoate synthesis repressor PhaR [Hyphomicrobiales bacterium]
MRRSPRSGEAAVSKSTKSTGRQDGPVRIKKYANRRLYNTETSAYVTLDDLAEMVRAEREFEVVDAKTGDDLTHSVLTQIILDQESRGETLLPINFLRQLIRFYGDSMEKMVPRYLEISMATLSREQQRFREQFGSAVATNPMLSAMPIEAFQRQAQQNLEMFEKAFSVFSAFGAPLAPGSTPQPEPVREEAAPRPAAAARPAAQSRQASREQPSPKSDPDTSEELKALRDQLAAIQKKLDRLED